LSKEETMTKKHAKKCSISLTIRETKTTLRVHLTLVRMAITQEAKYNKCWQGCEANRNPYTQSRDWKSVWRFLKKLKIELPDVATPLLLRIWRNQRQYTIETPEHPCLLQHYSPVKLWNHELIWWIHMHTHTPHTHTHTHTHWSIIQL
jgi:hypothetical protein